MSHEGLLKMLSLRIDDRAPRWLIRKWLKAGCLSTDGQVIHPELGTLQGGIFPLIVRPANVVGGAPFGEPSC
jgi:RNA-directed DNA polymerase